MTTRDRNQVIKLALRLRDALERIGPVGLDLLDPGSVPFENWIENLEFLAGDRDSLTPKK